MSEDLSLVDVFVASTSLHFCEIPRRISFYILAKQLSILHNTIYEFIWEDGREKMSSVYVYKHISKNIRLRTVERRKEYNKKLNKIYMF